MKNKLLTIFIAIIIIVSLIPTIWYGYVYFNAEDITVAKTYNVDLQTLEDGTQESLVDIQLFRNIDNSGLTAFEVRWNNVMDESRTQFYSQGSQFIADNFDYSWKAESFADHPQSKKYGTVHITYHDYYLLRQQFDNVSQYNYMSGNDYYDTLNDTNPINDDTFFRLTIKTDDTGSAEDDYDIYGMQFKGANKLSVQDSESYLPYDQIVSADYVANYYYTLDNSKSFTEFLYEERYYAHYFELYDYNYFVTELYNAVKDLPAGTNHMITVKFDDWFLYYEYDEDNKTYLIDPVSQDESAKITERAQSYWCINVAVYDSGLTKAEDSLFNSVKGSSTFNISGDYTEDDYFIGRTNIVVDETMVTFVNVYDDNFAIKLKDSFVDYYIKYDNLIVLTIDIDTELLLDKGINVVGFTADSGFENFIVRESNILEVQYD